MDIALRRITLVGCLLLGILPLEWWFTITTPGSQGSALAGMLLALLICVAHGALIRQRDDVWGAAVAALATVLELLVGIVIVSFLATGAVKWLPTIWDKHPQSEELADIVAIALFGLTLLVGARGWRRYGVQARVAAEAILAVEQAQRKQAEQEALLARSQLLVLRAQIDPHFLWNTLAHVQYLANTSPPQAAEMVGHLIGYLRTCAPRQTDQLSTLGKEADSVRDYLALIKIRMGTRLATYIEIPDSLRDVAFPPLILHTLVENAIKHGIEPKVGTASLCVRFQEAAVGEDRVTIEVLDNGVGLQAEPATRGTGIGLRSVRERLQAHFGDLAMLRIEARDMGGVCARISFPVPACHPELRPTPEPRAYAQVA